MAPRAPELTIIVVSHNTRHDVETCLGLLHEEPPATSHEIVVVDNASIDGTPDMVRAGWAGVRLIESPLNLGFSAANNLAIRSTKSEFILLLNPDTVVDGDAIDRLVQELRRDPETAIVGPRLVDAQGRAELSFGRMIGPFTELIQKTVGRLYEWRVGLAVRHVERETRTPQVVDWVSGACLLVRREDALAAGLLDERYFFSCEDVDFCAAVRELGRHVRFAPAAQIVHLRGRARATAPSATEAAYRRSQIAFYEKHHPRWAPLLRWYLGIRGKVASTDDELAVRATPAARASAASSRAGTPGRTDD